MSQGWLRWGDPLTIPAGYLSQPVNERRPTSNSVVRLRTSQSTWTISIRQYVCVRVWRINCVPAEFVRSWVWLFAFLSPINPYIFLEPYLNKGGCAVYKKTLAPSLLLPFSSSYMDSQVTLVAPSPPLSILFNSYSLRNAHISLSTVPSKALYTVHTTPLSPSGNTTLYICTGDQTLVVVQQNEMFPDQITFHEENGVKRKVSVSKWLKKGTLPDHW